MCAECGELLAAGESGLESRKLILHRGGAAATVLLDEGVSVILHSHLELGGGLGSIEQPVGLGFHPVNLSIQISFGT